MGRVEGKVAIVTGAAQGLGASNARVLAEQGAKVVLTDILEERGREVATQIGSNATFMSQDVSREQDWQRVINDAEGEFGAISVLVNNAAIATRTPIEKLTLAEYQRMIDVNQTSVFLGMRAVLPSMRRNGGGSIVNLSSAAGIVGMPGVLAYGASKFAVRGMTKTAAAEFASDNIRVNSIHPGAINTSMAPPTEEGQGLVDMVIATTALRRLGEPVEVSQVVLMLASDESSYITGAEIVVDGGFLNVR
ncbi:MAG: glucose 1-dehydrogenase [Gammaproteobacteria bacterium]|nr:glucose 1-dehydrogenase [Gammaproteobacteria bacterium]